LYFGEVFIDPIGIYGASQVFVLLALVAGNTAGDGYSGKLDQLGFDSFAGQFFQHSMQKDRRIFVFPRASVKGHDFHFLPPFFFFATIQKIFGRRLTQISRIKKYFSAKICVPINECSLNYR
jgi:hypothetical protein